MGSSFALSSTTTVTSASAGDSRGNWPPSMERSRLWLDDADSLEAHVRRCSMPRWPVKLSAAWRFDDGPKFSVNRVATSLSKHFLRHSGSSPQAMASDRPQAVLDESRIPFRRSMGQTVVMAWLRPTLPGAGQVFLFSRLRRRQPAACCAKTVLAATEYGNCPTESGHRARYQPVLLRDSAPVGELLNVLAKLSLPHSAFPWRRRQVACCQWGPHLGRSGPWQA